MSKFLKGFTIIELIVVIAIIAVLASIVMVNVAQYINKAKDAAIKANLKTIQTGAAAYFTGIGNGSYTGFSNSAASDAINNAGGSAVVTPSSDGTVYCASSPLVTDSTKAWCVDSKGYNKEGICSGGTCFSSMTAVQLNGLISVAQDYISAHGGASNGLDGTAEFSNLRQILGDEGYNVSNNSAGEVNNSYPGYETFCLGSEWAIRASKGNNYYCTGSNGTIEGKPHIDSTTDPCLCP